MTCMRGGDGGDRYVVDVGGGIDIVEDDGATGVDALALGVSGSAARLSLAGGGLLVDLGGGDGVQVTGFNPLDAYGSAAIERVTFTDGELSLRAARRSRLRPRGRRGADVISGTNAVDRFDGGAGDDRLLGGKGNDTYFFGKRLRPRRRRRPGPHAGNFDRVVLNDGHQRGDVAVKASVDRLTLRVRGTKDRLDIQWIPDAGLRSRRSRSTTVTLWDLATR